jgi:phage shock protein C
MAGRAETGTEKELACPANWPIIIHRIRLSPENPMNVWQSLKNLNKSPTDYEIGGVCGGLGATTEIPSWMWRAAFLFAMLGYGSGFLLYVVLWICLPEGDDPRKAKPSIL